MTTRQVRWLWNSLGWAWAGLFLAAAFPGSLAAAGYVDAEVYRFDSGTPDIGDRGVRRSLDRPSVPSVAFGYDLAPAIALEARYLSFGEFSVIKENADSGILPPDGAVLPVITLYEYRQWSEVLAIALPLTWREPGGRWRLTFAPELHHEWSVVVLDILPGNDPAVNYVPRFRYARRHLRKAGLGFGISAGWAIADAWDVHVSARYLDLETYNARMLGAGLRWHF